MNLGRKVKTKVSFEDFFFSRFGLLREGFFFLLALTLRMVTFFTGFLAFGCLCGKEWQLLTKMRTLNKDR